MTNISKVLIDELKEVKRKFNDIVNYNKLCGNKYELYKDVSDSFFPHVFEYCIITSSGVKYVINSCSSEFYEFDFDDIIYVYKHLNNYKFKNWDTVNGYYNDWNMLNNTLNKFNVTESVNDFID